MLSALKKVLHTILNFTPAICWGIFILYFSLIPGTEVPPMINEVNDKIIHASIYFLLTSLIYLGFVRFQIKERLKARPLRSAIWIGIVLGGLIELLQFFFIPGRAGEWLDFLANASGSLMFVLALVVYHRAKA